LSIVKTVSPLDRLSTSTRPRIGRSGNDQPATDTGSLIPTNTIGMVRVACRTAGQSIKPLRPKRERYRLGRPPALSSQIPVSSVTRSDQEPLRRCSLKVRVGWRAVHGVLPDCNFAHGFQCQFQIIPFVSATGRWVRCIQCLKFLRCQCQ
jgi:hypothetical protein